MTNPHQLTCETCEATKPIAEMFSNLQCQMCWEDQCSQSWHEAMSQSTNHPESIMIQTPSTINVFSDGNGSAKLVIKKPSESVTAVFGPAAVTGLIAALQLVQTGNESLMANAAKLRDQVMLTWNPPLQSGNESPINVAQTSTMLTIALLLGKDFLGPLTPNQQAAIDSGLPVFKKVIGT